MNEYELNSYSTAKRKIYMEQHAITSKLVRDNIPVRIRAQGKECSTRTATLEEMPSLLHEKLAEEVAEYLESGDPSELADILEVLHALAALHNLSPFDLESMRAEKSAARGRFGNRTVLELRALAVQKKPACVQDIS